jgi:flavin reductase (DIM6/NTAB) family NADH-FMN oxidoreductase RutF
MYYAVSTPPGEEPHGGLPWDPFKALVAPRPIAWISSLSHTGSVNLAPFSFFNIVDSRPNRVFFSTGLKPTGERKDSQLNAESAGEFVVNLVSWELRNQMNNTSVFLDRDVSEAELAGLDLAASVLVSTPRVAAAPAALECRYLETYALGADADGSDHARLVFGEVVGVHIADEFITGGRVDTAAMKLVARMGYKNYAVVTTTFSMDRRY